MAIPILNLFANLHNLRSHTVANAFRKPTYVGQLNRFIGLFDEISQLALLIVKKITRLFVSEKYSRISFGLYKDRARP
jgi:hypothetical protein